MIKVIEDNVKGKVEGTSKHFEDSKERVEDILEPFEDSKGRVEDATVSLKEKWERKQSFSL